MPDNPIIKFSDIFKPQPKQKEFLKAVSTYKYTLYGG